MAMSFVNLYTFPSFIPIPQLYAHVIRGRKNEGLRRVDDDGANIVRMCFERRDLFGRIIVVHPDLEIVGAAYYPILAGNEAPGPDRDIGELEGFDNGLSFFSVLCSLIGSNCSTCVSYDQM